MKLKDLLTVLLKPYLTESSRSENIQISAPEVMVSENSITSVAMLIHELTTNSAKYGALSSDTGRLILTCHDEEGQVEIVWTERGGPEPDASAQKPGFGRKMKDRIIRQLNGSTTRTWSKEGLIVSMRMSKASLGA